MSQTVLFDTRIELAWTEMSQTVRLKNMGCRCCWGHTGFASLKDLFDPGTVHHMLMYLWCNGSIADSKSVRSGFESLGVRHVFVGG